MNALYWHNPQSSYKVAVLIKDSYLIDEDLKKHYIDYINPDITDTQVICFGLKYFNNKITAARAREHIEKLVPVITKLGISHLYVPDASYFKILTKESKADTHYGYVLPCKFKGLEHLNVILGVNYGQLMYNPNLVDRMERTLTTLVDSVNGLYKPQEAILNDVSYPNTTEDIELALERLKTHSRLTCDIETYSLKLKDAGLATIAFAWSKHDGIAFKVNQEVRVLLKRFFESYKGQLIFHNASFDVKNIIFTCFMKHPLDYQNMLHGLHTMCKNLHDTKIIAYLATNSTAGNVLGLKDLSQEYMGNYAEDVSDITLLDDKTLLEYNLKDVLATMYVFEKYYPIMLKDNQESIYKTLMLPSLKTIIQMELCGMPIDANEVQTIKAVLESNADKYIKNIQSNPYVVTATLDLKMNELAKINAALKTKQHGIEKVADYEFNPNSNQHLQFLLYDVIGLPVIDTTSTKQPATGADTLAKLVNHTNSDKVKELLQSLIDLSKVNKILSAFIPSFENAFVKANSSYLHGSFNLGGTLSGRLSSSNPNLQQLPSGSIYGSLVKKCFKAPKGWLFMGSDYSSLEDRINALLTKDKNKLKVYTDGFDGHMLRAISYFGLPVDLNDVQAVNDSMKQYKKERQASKPITFACTYGGSYLTLMNSCGFTEDKAKQIESNYHELYKESDEWAKAKLETCSRQGYIDVAFGLRIRTPLVGRTVIGSSKTPNMAAAEARSVANAFSGQSYGLLTNRALNEFMERVWNSEYKHDILPVATIHDAIYLMARDDIRIVKWINDNLIECMAWQELPEIQHDEVKLASELGIFYPDWSNEITLPNHTTEEEILNICRNK